MNLANEFFGSMAVPVVAVSACGIVVSCLTVIFRMTPKTDHLIRIFYTTIAAGAFGELIYVFAQRIPSVPETLLTVGVGMLFLFDRRSGFKARPPQPCVCDKKVAP